MREGKKRAQKIHEALGESKTARQELASLRRQLEEQRQITRALWNMLKSKFDWHDTDLLTARKEIEEAEASAAREAESCPNCGRALLSGPKG